MFDTGIYTSPVDLLGKVAAFADACGWNVISGGLGGDSPGQFSLESADDGLWVHAIAENANSRIRSMPASGYTNDSTQFYAHAGSANNSSTLTNHVILSPLSGAGVAYWLFGNAAAPRYIHCVVEVTAGRFLHWMFGTLRKYGTWTGGGYDSAMFWHTSQENPNLQTIPFCSASNGNSDQSSKQYLRVDSLLGKPSPYWSDRFGLNSKGPLSGAQDSTRHLIAGGMDPVTGRSILAPIYARLKNNEGDGAASSRQILLGEVQDARIISMDGRNPKDIITLGGDDWYVFPLRERPSNPSTSESVLGIGGTAPDHHSQNFGLAYRVTE